MMPMMPPGQLDDDNGIEASSRLLERRAYLGVDRAPWRRLLWRVRSVLSGSPRRAHDARARRRAVASPTVLGGSEALSAVARRAVAATAPPLASR